METIEVTNEGNPVASTVPLLDWHTEVHQLLEVTREEFAGVDVSGLRIRGQMSDDEVLVSETILRGHLIAFRRSDLFAGLSERLGWVGQRAMFCLQFPRHRTRPSEESEILGEGFLTIDGSWVRLDERSIQVQLLAVAEFESRRQIVLEENRHQHLGHVRRLAALEESARRATEQANFEEPFSKLPDAVRQALTAGSKFPAGSVERNVCIALARSFVDLGSRSKLDRELDDEALRLSKGWDGVSPIRGEIERNRNRRDGERD